jgi:general secretion pathway protein D
MKFDEEKLVRLGITTEPELILANETEDRPEVSTDDQSEQPTEEKISSEELAKNEADRINKELDEPAVEFNFENADLEMLINQISELFDITFVADDSITPMLQGARSVRGNKISFKTQRTLSKREAWNLFLTFLDISGFTAISEGNPKIRRIVTIEAARKSPLPAYIGVPASTLPNNDEMVRFVYFLENASLDTMRTVVDSLRSPNSSLVVLQELKAFVLTDKAYNIKSLMNIVYELDKVTMPQAMSVLKLRRADAKEVKLLYDSLAQVDEKSVQQQRFFPGRKLPSNHYFSDQVSVFAEPRTNSLILLGPADSIKRLEDFIMQSVDTDLTVPYSPLHVLPLKYADATTVANIMNEVTKFGATTEAGRAGGVRGGDKYLKPITFTPEPETNRIVVKGDYEDFLKAKEVILELDAPQPQVAIEVLLLGVTLNERKQLGAQIRTNEPSGQGLFGTNVTYQTSGLFGTEGIQESTNGTGVNRLLGNLLNLVSSGVAAGNTIVSLGDSLSVWAIIQALQTASNVQVLANPFLIATNKTKALVSLGEVRRVITGTIVGTSDVNTFGDAPAKLEVAITPQINSDGMIILDIIVSLSQFVGAANPENAVRTVREIKTKAIVTNKEVIALGGLVQNNIEDQQTKVPILGDIPILGWLFKNKQKTDTKSNLLVLISSRIIEPTADEDIIRFTQNHITDYTDTANEMIYPSENRDPINRWFFAPPPLNESVTDEFIYRRQARAIGNNKLHMDTVAPTPMAQTEQAPAPIKTALAPKKSRKLSNALTDQKEARA